ncbi:Scr1 family TA system antitoxin-like transcriptional regulator [Streptomyces sp. NPDC048172]|uniref:helix-turn-helix domain-containing protein n=1 Tax=Streptomyces sp. NPDC048172 TaxID=3365505 RepID=UPI00371C42EE
MAEREHKSAREKYGEELRRRRVAAGLTQTELSVDVVCSHTLISHIEAGRRLPTPDDAKRLDKALKADDWFSRWLEDLEPRYADHFNEAAELERQATELRQYGAMLIPGLLQTPEYARTVFRAYSPNHTASEVDKQVVNRTERSLVLEEPTSPVVWTLLDEAVIRRPVGGRLVMPEQLTKIADMGESGRIRLHVLPFSAGAHSLMEGMVSLMSFSDSAPVAYVEGVVTGNLMDDPALVTECRASYDLAMSDALSQQDSLALMRAVAEDHSHGK